jgi:hypothetical protein
VKLTAPQTPPEPGPEPTPAPPPVEASDTPASPEVPPAPVERPPEKMARWPAWFAGADALMALLAIAVAFLAASFAARNSDLWVHLGAGRMLTTGEYKLGSDPFSYVGADRTWVNHNWLFDLGAFLLYRGDGFVLVLMKAIAVALAFALLMAIRRPGQSLWPWAFFATLAILTSPSHFLLRPLVASLVFFALTLYLLFRTPSRPGSWRLPIIIGITFCLWSNWDGWFILGPFVLLLLLTGEFVRKKLSSDNTLQPADALLGLPDAGTLARCLLVGVIACMINPHHIGVWELPFELFPSEGARLDYRFDILFVSPILHEGKPSSTFWTSPGLWGNANGVAYAILFLAGIYVTFLSGAIGRFLGGAADLEPLPLPYALLWIAFAALSLLRIYGLIFFAMVTVPLVASRCNLFSSRLVLQGWSDQRTRALLMGSTGGRILCVLGLVGIALAAWPGWLHAPASQWWESGLAPNNVSRRVEWIVRPDPELRQAAEWLQDERASARLPEQSRGFLASLDLANYCAWYAPNEKVFLNGRYCFHRNDFKSFALVRQGLGLFRNHPEAEEGRESIELLKKWKVEYLGIAILPTDAGYVRANAMSVIENLWLETRFWSIWYFNGRSTICGWRPAVAEGKPSFDQLAIDPLVLAYGKGVKPAAPVAIHQPIVVQDGLDEFLRPRPPAPSGAEDAYAWIRFKQSKKQPVFFAQQIASLLQVNVPGIALPPIGPAKFLARDSLIIQQAFASGRLPEPRTPSDGSFETYALLALRAARQAIAESPDHPDGYFMLALVLGDRDLPMPEPDRKLAQLTAYRQCMLRLPTPANFRRGEYMASPTQVVQQLSLLYLGQRFPTGDFQGARVDAGVIGEMAGGSVLYSISSGGRPNLIRLPPRQQPPPGATQVASGLYLLPLDSARKLLDLAEQYAKIEYTEPEMRSNFLKGLDDLRKQVDTILRRTLDRYQARTERAPKLRDRIDDAIGLGLIDLALDHLKTADLAKEYGEVSTEVALRLIALQLALGRLEDASEYLATLREEFNLLAEKPGGNSERMQDIRKKLTELEYHKFVLEGNYGEAGKVLEQLYGKGVGEYPAYVNLTRPDMKGFDPAKLDARPYQIFGIAWWQMGLFINTNPFGSLGQLVLSNEQFRRYQIWVGVFNHMQEDSEFFFRRGYLALLEGDIPGAKARFQSAHRQPPPGWKLVSVNHREAAMFLNLIEKAEKKK